MTRNFSLILLFGAIFVLEKGVVHGFSTGSSASSNAKYDNLVAEPTPEMTSRRKMLFGIATASIAGIFGEAKPASASYSAYTRREEDWSKRLEAGEVKITSARNLKQQLREIAPMNGEGSKIFCPNGPSASVSPLMENKCGDQMATPSVFGRQDDIVGNSVPGFKSGYDFTVGGGSSSLSAYGGGFPTYKENEIQLKQPRR